MTREAHSIASDMSDQLLPKAIASLRGTRAAEVVAGAAQRPWC